MDLNKIKDNYRKMTDEEIVRMITNNSEGLMDEVYPIIENEIIKRNLNPDLINALYSHNKSYSLDQIEAYANILRALACPICHDRTHPLNGTEVYFIKSLIFFTITDSKTIIACPECLNQANRKAFFNNLLLGWWGLPFGLIKTPQYLYKNYKSENQNGLPFANKTLLNFTLLNIKSIEAFQGNTDELNRLIQI